MGNCHVAHDCDVGNNVIMAQTATIGGHVLYAPDSKKLRKILWDPRFDALREKIEAEEQRIRTMNLPQHLKDRVDALVENRNRIRHLAEKNPSFSQSLLKGELVKTERIVTDFIDMAERSTRYEDYLGSIDIRELERDPQRWETRMRTGKPGEPETEIAKKNYGIILQRLDKIREIRNFLSVSQGQLDLIENSFKLIADQIVTMQSPGELVGQLSPPSSATTTSRPRCRAAPGATFPSSTRRSGSSPASRQALMGQFAVTAVEERCRLLAEEDQGERPAGNTRLQSRSRREQEILRMSGRGRRRAEIAKTLFRSPKTVDAHRTALMEKLGIHDRVDLVRFATREGLVEP